MSYNYYQECLEEDLEQWRKVMDKRDKRVLVEVYDGNTYVVDYNTEAHTYDVYRKPKRVKVDFSVLKVTYSTERGEEYYAVRFKIENWSGGKFSVHYRERDFGWGFVKVDSSFVRTASAPYVALSVTDCPLYIGKDAQDKWSAPVIFNREQREKLQDLCKYLEEKLNAPS